MLNNVKMLIGALAGLAIIACVVLAVVLLINRGGEEGLADPLAGTQWQVQSFLNPAQGGSLASPLADTQLTAEFSEDASTEESIVSGSAGCNRFTAGYIVDGDSLSIAQPASTMMFCEGPEGVMDQEAAFLAVLVSAGSFEIQGENLYIADASGTRVLEGVRINR